MTLGLGRIKPRLPTQPRDEVVIDWGNRLTNGLMFSCYNSVPDSFKPPYDYVSGAIGTASGVLQTQAGYGGTGYKALATGSALHDVSTGFYTRILSAPKFNGTSAWSHVPLDLSPLGHIATLAFWMRIDARTACSAIEYGANLSTAQGFQINPGSSSQVFFIQGSSPSGQAWRNWSATQPTLGAWEHWLWQIDRTLNPAQIPNVDGVVGATSSGSTTYNTGQDWGINQGLNMGARDSGASLFATVALCSIQIWNRLLTTEETKAFFSDSFQIFKPLRNKRTIFLMPGFPSGARTDRWFLTG